jgi:hypothetical protein
MKGMKGPTRAQLQSRIDRLEAQNAKLRERLKPDPIRRLGEHWYELIEFFDATKIERIAVIDQASYLMGMLQDAIVIEVPEGTSEADMVHFTAQLRKAGVRAPPIYIWEGVRFLKLAAVGEEMERRLDAAGLMAEEDDEKPEEPGTDPADAAGPGPEPSGDGLGDRLPPDGEDPGSGGDRDRPAAEEGSEAPDGE